MAHETLRKMAKAAVVMAAAATVTACGGAATSSKVGPAGGTVAAAGVSVTFPAGALSKEIEVSVIELPRREGEGRRVHVGPDDTVLALPATLRISSDDGNASDEKMVEIEHRGGLEIEHGIETERHHAGEHAREAEVRHLGEYEVRHARACAVACGAGLECDDGVCKPHGGSLAPGSVPVPADGVCPAGMELEPTDGVCKPHGGAVSPGTVTAPADGTCGIGMELDLSDGICKPHGGSGSGSGA